MESRNRACAVKARNPGLVPSRNVTRIAHLRVSPRADSSMRATRPARNSRPCKRGTPNPPVPNPFKQNPLASFLASIYFVLQSIEWAHARPPPGIGRYFGDPRPDGAGHGVSRLWPDGARHERNAGTCRGRRTGILD